MTSLTISTITVCRNSSLTIGGTLASVAAQTQASVEHVVVDGGSTDDTMRIVNRFPHVAIAISEADRGIYDAMNKGVRLAGGDVLCFLNADDRYAHPNVLADVATIFERHDVDAVLADIAFVDFKSARILRRYSAKHFHPGRLAWGWMPPHPGLFVRREVFDRVGLFSTSYRIAGDYEWIVRAFTQNELRYRHLCGVVVHMAAGGVSTSGWRSTALLNREVIRALRDNGVPTNWFKVLTKYPAKLLEYLRR